VPEQGMVMDFSEVKRIVREQIVDRWDHAFLVYKNDTTVVDFLHSLQNHKTIILDSQPTAENLANTAFLILDQAFQENYGDRLKLERVRLYETPNCWADATRIHHGT
jgi:6-pyruvoyltetrahydropterin/6-carboxytetrahydropterin synthase